MRALLAPQAILQTLKLGVLVIIFQLHHIQGAFANVCG